MPVHEIDDDAFEWIIDHRGRPAKIVKAGVTYRVPMMARDSLSPVQQAIIADRMRVTDANGDSGIGLRKPGARFTADAGLYDAAAKAYAQRAADSERAWIDGPGGGQHSRDFGETSCTFGLCELARFAYIFRYMVEGLVDT